MVNKKNSKLNSNMSFQFDFHYFLSIFLSYLTIAISLTKLISIIKVNPIIENKNVYNQDIVLILKKFIYQ